MCEADRIPISTERSASSSRTNPRLCWDVLPAGTGIRSPAPARPGGSGWVYAANLTVTAQGELPVVQIPVTVTPLFTATVDATLAAAFPPIQPTAPRLPTFTPAAPQTPPVFADAPSLSLEGNPFGVFIIVVATLGLALLLLSFFVKR